MKPERRALALEIRAKGRKLEGYAATFDNPATIGGRFVETIARGAFAATLRSRGDVLALVDHDPGRVLARTRSGTLRLAEDTRGLSFDLDVPDTSHGRELRAVELHEISVVLAWPAYDGTVIHARSLENAAPFRRYAERALKLLELSR